MTEQQTGKGNGRSEGVIALFGLISIAAVMLSIMALVVAIANRNHVTIQAAPEVPTIAIVLSDYKVGLPSTSIAAGTVTLNITNAGSQAHELLVVDTSLDPSKFPKEADGSLNETGPGINIISDGDNLDPGGSQTRSVDLTKPGKYVLICNLPGHFAEGMYTTVTVH